MRTYDEDDMREAREDQRAVVKEFEKRLAVKDAEIKRLQKTETTASVVRLMDEIEMRHGINEDRWGILRGILEGKAE